MEKVMLKHKQDFVMKIPANCNHTNSDPRGVVQVDGKCYIFCFLHKFQVRANGEFCEKCAYFKERIK